LLRVDGLRRATTGVAPTTGRRARPVTPSTCGEFAGLTVPQPAVVVLHHRTMVWAWRRSPVSWTCPLAWESHRSAATSRRWHRQLRLHRPSYGPVRTMGGRAIDRVLLRQRHDRFTVLLVRLRPVLALV